MGQPIRSPPGGRYHYHIPSYPPPPPISPYIPTPKTLTLNHIPIYLTKQPNTQPSTTITYLYIYIIYLHISLKYLHINNPLPIYLNNYLQINIKHILSKYTTNIYISQTQHLSLTALHTTYIHPQKQKTYCFRKHIASGIQPENQNGHQQDNIQNTTYIYPYSHFKYINLQNIYIYQHNTSPNIHTTLTF